MRVYGVWQIKNNMNIEFKHWLKQQEYRFYYKSYTYKVIGVWQITNKRGNAGLWKWDNIIRNVNFIKDEPGI
jgi:hypothetical protein